MEAKPRDFVVVMLELIQEREDNNNIWEVELSLCPFGDFGVNSQLVSASSVATLEYVY